MVRRDGPGTPNLLSRADERGQESLFVRWGKRPQGVRHRDEGDDKAADSDRQRHESGAGQKGQSGKEYASR
eukprot:10632829-Karenia_brevis.AAC.1